MTSRGEPLRATDILPFFDAACRARDDARRRANERPQHWLDLGGAALRLDFAGEAMLANVVPALAHLAIPPRERADLEVSIWDSASTGVRMPPPPWSPGDYVARGEIRGQDGSQGIELAYNPGSGVLSMFCAQRGSAMLWTHDARRSPYWEQAAPLRTLLNWWSSRRRQQLVHAAAVGSAAGAVLLTGRGGSGKSTTALSALLSGMDYIGDDYVLCDLSGAGPVVHSLYNTAKVDAATLEYLPALGRMLHNPERPADEKAVIFVQQHFPQQMCRRRELRAVVVPRICQAPTPRLAPMRPATAYLALSPTTIFQLPGAREQALAFLKQMVECLPCFQLELSRDPAQNSAAIRHLLESLP